MRTAASTWLSLLLMMSSEASPIDASYRILPGDAAPPMRSRGGVFEIASEPYRPWTLPAM